MCDVNPNDTAVVTSRSFKKGVSGRYLFNFEDSIREITDAELLQQSAKSYKLYRFLNILRGKQNSNSLSPKTIHTINILGGALNIGDNPIKLPTAQYFKSKQYSTLILILGQVYEVQVLDTLDWKNKYIILYVGDPWEPDLDELSQYIDQYNIDCIFVPFLRSFEILNKVHRGVHWLPQAVCPTVWTDYDLEKTHKYIQFGRKDPRLHDFALGEGGEEEYIYRFIEGDVELAKAINRSKFCFVSPRKLQYPERTGDVSPVTLRYFQAMACKSLPAGFKPEEFNDVFSSNVDFVEYTTRDQFKNELTRYNNNKTLYQRAVNKNYRLLNEGHTWRDRAQEFVDTFKTELS